MAAPAPAPDAAEQETGLLYEPESEDATGLLYEPESEYETGLLYEPESENMTTLLSEVEIPAQEAEEAADDDESEFATGLLVEPASEDATGLLYEPESEDATGLLVEPASEGETTLLNAPDDATTVLQGIDPDAATGVVGAPSQPAKPQATATAAGVTPRKREKFKRAYELPDSALQPQTEPTYAGGPVMATAATQSQPIYIMPVVAQPAAPAPAVEKKSSRGVWVAVIGAALGVALALFLAFQLGLVGGVRVPDVTGLSPDNATMRLEDAGFKVTTHEEIVDQGVGIVVSVEPAASSTLANGSTVDIGIGVPRLMPDIYGVNVNTAIDELESVGALNIVVQYVISPSYEDGTVISVSPAPGTKFNESDPVTIEVAEKA